MLGLIAVLLFSVTAAQATAPIAKEIPDIRSAIDTTATGSPAATVLELDDYVIDPDDRNADGVQIPLVWAESSTLGDDNVSVTGNELQVSIPSVAGPESGRTTFSVTDQDTEADFVGPVTVKTTTLLAAPLVDDFLNLGPANSAVPYSWGADAGQTLRIEPGNQPGGGGRLFLNVSSGVGENCFSSASTFLADATAQANPLSPNSDPIALHGLKYGSGAAVSLQSANISVDAGLGGMFVQPLAGFSDWVRVTVTRTYGDGSGDTYSVAIGDLLQGVASTGAVFDGGGVTTSGGNLGGADIAASVSLIDATSVFGFEGVDTEDFIGFVGQNGSAAGINYDPLNTGSRVNQTTSWSVTSLGQSGESTGGNIPCTVTVTSDGVPAATYPGATSGRALKCEFTRPDGEGILVSHRGISPTEYSAGDVLTFTMNTYVDLNYGGGTADTINEGVNAPSLAMALSSQPIGDLGSFNYLNFAPFATTTAANVAALPNGGFQDYTNPLAAIHGKWTQHQVSFRVPQIGRSVTGPNGVGNLNDASGVAAQFLVARIDTDAPPAGQIIWIDNLAVTACPSALAFAHGAVNCPMVAAGFASSPNNSTILGNGLPAALARGAKINGNFSTVGDGTTTTVGGTPLVGVTPGFAAASNASKGWPENVGNTDAAFIGTGAAQVSLRFPDPTTFNQALVLTPNPGAVANNFPNPSNAAAIAANGYAGKVGVNSGFLDMVLASEAVPGLRVSDVAYAAGTGGASTQNALNDNVSGVFGVRFFARTNGANPADNPSVNVVISDADVTRGLVGVFTPASLPNGADASGAGTVWAECSVSGSFITFTSPQQSGFLANFGGGNATTIADLAADNPSRQLAQVQINRIASQSADSYRLNAAIFKQVYAPVLGTGALTAGSAGSNAAPGRYNTATAYVDEVGVYAVRDSAQFYDEDLGAFAALP